jgi:hypothetical protein
VGIRIIYKRTEWLKTQQWCKWAGLSPEGKGSVTEVMWLGRAVRDGGSEDIWIDEVRFLHKQNKATGGECSISADEMADFIAMIIAEGGDPMEWNYWGHSHASMGAFQSGQDISNTRERFEQKPWAVAVTHNAKGDAYGELTMFQPFYVRVEKVPVLIESVEEVLSPEEQMAKSEVQAWNDRVSKEVTATHYAGAVTYFPGEGGWGSGGTERVDKKREEKVVGEAKGSPSKAEDLRSATLSFVGEMDEGQTDATLKEYEGEEIEVDLPTDYVEYRVRAGELEWNSLTFNGGFKRVSGLLRKQHALSAFIRREMEGKEVQYREFTIGGDFLVD